MLGRMRGVSSKDRITSGGILEVADIRDKMKDKDCGSLAMYEAG